jgi:hypothetical protein
MKNGGPAGTLLLARSEVPLRALERRGRNVPCAAVEEATMGPYRRQLPSAARCAGVGDRPQGDQKT